MRTRVLEYAADPAQLAIWDGLNSARVALEFDACYCSVLDECFRSDLVSMTPTRVDACPARGPDKIGRASCRERV